MDGRVSTIDVHAMYVTSQISWY